MSRSAVTGYGKSGVPGYEVHGGGSKLAGPGITKKSAMTIARKYSRGGKSTTVEFWGDVVARFKDGRREGSSNPSRRLTKTQRKEKSRRASAKRRVANALKKFLQQANPGRKLAGASVRKNKGSITIVPVFLKKRK